MSDTLTYLMGNRWTKNAEGEFISVKDAYAVPPISLTVGGKSTQITTTGKNLLSDVVEDYVSGSKVNGASRRYLAIPVEEGASYTYSRASSGYGFYMGWADDLISPITIYDSITMTNRATYTFTNSDNHAYLVLSFSTSYTTGAWVNNVNTHKYMIEKGSTVTSYESFSGGIASPSPSWPQPIEDVDSLSLYVTGKNVYGGNEMVKNRTVKEDSHGRYLTEADLVTTEDVGFPFKENVRYTLVLTGVRVTDAHAHSEMRVQYTNGVMSEINWSNATVDELNTTVYTSAVDRTVNKFYSGNGFSGSPKYYVDECGIFEGIVTADQFEPYVGVCSSDLLDGYSLRSLPNGTKDELHLTYLRPSDRPGWAWYDRKLVRRVGHEVVTEFDGVGRGSASGGANAYSFYVDISEDAKNVLGICSHAEWRVSGTSTYNYFKAGWIWLSWGDTKKIYISISNTYNTLSLANEWLEENGPIIFDYELATPETIHLDPIELPTMQSGLTNIWSDPSTNLSITYERDKNIVITNLKAAVNDLATS